MERLSEHTPSGMKDTELRRWGYLFLAAGLLGKGLIQTHLLGFHNLSMEQMLMQMSQSREVMTLATISLVLQAVETCAAPIFALLLVDRVEKGRADLTYLGKLLLLALVCEMPYNFVMGASFWDLESRNPVFALALSLVMLLFYQRYRGPGLQKAAIRLVVTLAAILWGGMLRIDNGAPLVLIVAVLWAMRGKPLYRSFVGAAAAVVCMGFSPFYLASPMGFLAASRYNGEREPESTLGILVYPGLLAVTAALGYVAPNFL